MLFNGIDFYNLTVIQVLESATDAELLTLLLQLVQALRYEPNLEGVVATMGTAPNPEATPATSSSDDSAAVLWCRTISEASPLAVFLMKRGCASYNGLTYR